MYEDEDGGHEGRLVGGHLYEDLDEDDVHGVCLVEPGLGLHVPDIDGNMETLTSGKHSVCGYPDVDVDCVFLGI